MFHEIVSMALRIVYHKWSINDLNTKIKYKLQTFPDHHKFDRKRDQYNIANAQWDSLVALFVQIKTKKRY